MRRFYHSGAPAGDGIILLEGPEAHHAAHVIRLQTGDGAGVLDGRGHEHLCTAVAIDRHQVALRVGRTIFRERDKVKIRLVQAITKGKSFEFILQRAVELGCAEIWPVISEHSISRPDPGEFAGKRRKWEQTAIEAIKQCGAFWLPQVGEPGDLNSAIAGDRASQLRLMGSLAGGALHPRRMVDDYVAQHQQLPASISIWIGPEGDFSPSEAERLVAAGVHPVTLGSNVLRSETAALCALAVLNYEVTAPR